MGLSILGFLIGIPLGFFVENIGEWLSHRYILHYFGKQPGSIWAYHWFEHHRTCRRQGMFDSGYQHLPLYWNTQGKEALFLLVVAALNAPLLSIVPGYVVGLYLALICYYYKHRRAHLDPEWAKTQLPWHWEHHMGQNPESNWCITWNWFDCLMKTRSGY